MNPLEKLSAIMSKNSEIIENAKQELRKAYEDGLKDAVKYVFTEVPQLEAVSWAQYTPYFNDGEACTFYVCEPEYILKNDPDYEEKKEEHHSEWWHDKNENALLSKEQYELVDNFLNAVQYDDDTMLYMYGDHVQVIITADGVETEEYDHD